MTVKPITPPTLMLMPPPIMTMVRLQEMMISAALSLSRSKTCCTFRKPPPRKIIAAAYITTNMPMLMVVSSWASVRGSLRRVLEVFAPVTQPTPFFAAAGMPPARFFLNRPVSFSLTTGEPATTMMMMTMAL